MEKKQAVEWLKEIQNGGFDRYEIKDKMPIGTIAQGLWDDTNFSYGMEYGAIMAIMKIFNLDKSEI